VSQILSNNLTKLLKFDCYLNVIKKKSAIISIDSILNLSRRKSWC